MSEFWRRDDLPHLEARRSSQENSCYRPHTHDTFSVGLIDAGTSVLAGHLGGVIRLRPGDVVLIPADHVHDCNPDDGAWRYQMIHIDQEWAASLAQHDPRTRHPVPRLASGRQIAPLVIPGPSRHSSG
ncbi:AraC family ligand binding domain-containing protein [Microbacterium sp. 18062]|uniref:AraC family ligand binding domain-containing protein n=1 Tax=Microbacterium sp. 18062 TaxID=2681410 RepID=UPI0013573AE9|nr:AraC family ligand binding domain-containing protein [Microbacterium sp. 18062]